MDLLPRIPDPANAEQEADQQLLERIAAEIVRRRLTTPAILFLESVKPLNFIGSQFLVFLDPVIKLFLSVPEYDRFTRMLEDRGTLERLIGCIEGAEEADSAHRERSKQKGH